MARYAGETLVVVLVAMLAAAAGALAQERIGDGGIEAPAPRPDDAEPNPEQDMPGEGGKPGKGDRRPPKLRLLRADARPSIAWFKGRPATFRFAIDGRRKRDVVVQVKRKGRDPKIVRRFVVRNVRPGEARTVDWNGRTDGGRYARQGAYKFKVRARRGGAAIADEAAGRARAAFFKHKFPVRGAHTYGDGLGAGRRHRGLDVFAGCGTTMQAARGGRVEHKGFQRRGAGHYVVIDGKGTGKDYVYMHLESASPLAAGDRVGTGERIGRVGESGNASGCHLHFELWSAPGWYAGGDFVDPEPRMRAWDRWS